MSKNIYDQRIGVKRSDGYTSSVWRLWATRHGDVYLATRQMAGIEKFSFHKSGLCRCAFTKEHGRPRTMSDRVVFKWWRHPTPQTVNSASRVLSIAVPTDFLSREIKIEKKRVTWIDAAPGGGATYLELAFSCAAEAEAFRLLEESGSRHLLKYVPLQSGDALLVTFCYGDWDNKDLTSPATPGSVFPDLLFSADDPRDTGRPLRILLGPKPKDGEAVMLQELGGYTLSRAEDRGDDR